MKTVKQIIEQINYANDENHIVSGLSQLVESGLLDESKLPLIKRALTKTNINEMTEAERKVLLESLNVIVDEITEAKRDHLTAFDKRMPQGYPSDKEAPPVLILKRKAIRVYPDNQKVALYYSQALDKHISIPFGPNSDTAGVQISEAKYSDLPPDIAAYAKQSDIDEKRRRVMADIVRRMRERGDKPKQVMSTMKGLEQKHDMPGQGVEVAKEVISKEPVKGFFGKLNPNAYRTGQELGLAFAAWRAKAPPAESPPISPKPSKPTKPSGPEPIPRMFGESSSNRFRNKLSLMREQEAAVDYFPKEKKIPKTPSFGIGEKEKNKFGTPSNKNVAVTPTERLKGFGKGLRSVNPKDFLAGLAGSYLEEPARKILRKVPGASKALRLPGSGEDAKTIPIPPEMSKLPSGLPSAPTIPAKPETKPLDTPVEIPSFSPGKHPDRDLPDKKEVPKETPKAPAEVASAAAPATAPAAAPAIIPATTPDISKNPKPKEKTKDRSPRRPRRREGDKDSSLGPLPRKPPPKYEFSLKIPTIDPMQNATKSYGTVATGQARKEQETLWKGLNEQSNFNKIRILSENKDLQEDLLFEETSITVNNRVAKKIMNLHESLNKENKRKVEKMINEDVSSLKKVINFAVRHH